MIQKLIVEFFSFWFRPGLQKEVSIWLKSCFHTIELYTKQMTPEMRALRFYEEATELVQAMGLSPEKAKEVQEYVYNRPKGEISQEVGGTSISLLTICVAYDIDWVTSTRTELSRIYERIPEIRAKQASKVQATPE